jgi:excinuclease ABC subunit C
MEERRYTPDEIHLLPNEPGVYKFFNKKNELIYVGKAKDLKKRVASYFSKSHQHNRKTLKLISEINVMEYILSSTEFNALLLENNLIKTSQPKYNILLKDDKTFPYVCILKERFPRIITTRKFKPEQGEYFGPFSNVVAMRTVVELIRKLYHIRTCSLALSQKNIADGKFKVCLEYHLGNCLGPCTNLQSEQQYLDEIQQARQILKGNLGIVASYFETQMKEEAEKLAFEKAQDFKLKLEVLQNYQAKNQVVNPKISDLDVATILADTQYAYINYLQIRTGAINFSKTVEIKKMLEENDEEVLAQVVADFQETFKSTAKEVITNVPILTKAESIENQVPKIGDKLKLIQLSVKNAHFYRKERYSRQDKKGKKQEILELMQKELHLSDKPDHIECFDNSNLQGTFPVASMVCFKQGEPAKKEYRHYNIKTVEGPNDFASMQEVVYRRYKRLLEEEVPLPKLIIVDGGKGQLSSACEALKELNIYGKVPIIGIAKRLEEIYFPEDSTPLYIHKKSPTLLLIQRIRDEAHRFAITYHRNKRSKGSIKSELEGIPGIGQKTIFALLKEFKHVKNIIEASQHDIEKVIGPKKAGLLIKNLHKT